jgi:hypothetical protein
MTLEDQIRFLERWARPSNALPELDQYQRYWDAILETLKGVRDRVDLELRARASFERASAGYANAPKWEELSDETREIHRDWARRTAEPGPGRAG